MRPQEMQKRSGEKVGQIMELMKLLNMSVDARQRVSREGFIENVIFWSDNEKYPTAPEVVREPEGATGASEEKPATE